MKIIASTSIAALLGACATAPSAPIAPTVNSIGSAQFTLGSPSVFTVSQSGAGYALSSSAPRTSMNQNGFTYWNWAAGGATISGNATGITPATGGYIIAAGLDGSTYFAGISGIADYAPLAATIANLTGGYAFVVNGADQSGPLDLSVNFGTGLIGDTSAGIDVAATISGANITGTVDISGETSALKGGFYIDSTATSGYKLVGVALGTNMAGILSVE